MSELEQMRSPEDPAGDDAVSGVLVDAPAGVVVPVAPVLGGGDTAAGRPARPKGLLRWGIALVVVAILAGATSVGAALLAGSGATSSLAGWAPANTLMYAEMRADMPGDQKAKMGALLARLPGFRDQSTLDQKLDEALDRMMESGKISFSRDVKPWLSGEMAMVATPGLFAAQAHMGPRAYSDTEYLAKVPKVTDGFAMLAVVRDQAAAQAFIRSQAGDLPAATQYNGFSLTTLEDDQSAMSVATGEKLLIVGLTDTVKAVIDTRGAGTFATSAGFAEARKVAPAAYLGYGYMDMKAYMAGAMSMAAAPAEDSMVEVLGVNPTKLSACMADKMAGMLPAWESGFLAARDDALLMKARVPETKGALTATASVSALAKQLPGTTVLSMNGRDAGRMITSGWKTLTDLYGCDEQLKGQLEQIEKTLASIGGLDALIGWAGETALAVTADGSQWGGGLASIARDAAGAQRAFNQLQTVIALGGQSMGIASNSTTYAGGELVTVDLPAGAGIPALAVAVRDGLFVLGTADFVKATLDATPASSLAAQPRYARAIGMVSDKASMEAFVDITGIRTGLERAMAGQLPGNYATEVGPFLEAFESFFMTQGEPAGGTWDATGVLVFR